jgi:hypothetical protein
LAARRSHPLQNGTGTRIGKHSDLAEENPPARRLNKVKKEEEFSGNRAKKTQGKKIPFLTVSFASVPFQR